MDARERMAGAVPFDMGFATPCLFLPNKPDRSGYLPLCVRRDGVKRTVLAHRYLYEALVAPIPEGEELDHLCRQRACVNVWEHLESVPPRVNALRSDNPPARNARKTHCAKGGHPQPEGTAAVPHLQP